MKVLAIIPARGDSKQLPMKNIRKLAGKPLIEYSIKSARQSQLINKILVSTNDKVIAKISKSLGAEVPFLRPKKLSQNSSTTIDVIKHATEFLYKTQSYIPDIITLLQPTTPLRTAEMIDKSIRMLTRSKADTVIGVSKIKTHPYRSFWYQKKYLKPFRKDFLKFHQRQLFPDCFYPTGSIYTFWYKTLKKYNQIYGSKIKPYIINENEKNVDINTLFDFFICEMIISNWMMYKQRFQV